MAKGAGGAVEEGVASERRRNIYRIANIFHGTIFSQISRIEPNS